MTSAGALVMGYLTTEVKDPSLRVMLISLAVKSRSQLEQIMSLITRIHGIQSVDRVTM